MAQIYFFGGTNHIDNLTGSGLGFFSSAGFGGSVSVGEYQGRTYITNSAGTALGPECPNVKFLNSASGILGQVGTGIALTAIPNSQATLKTSFTHSSAVKIQNVEARIYDRSNINNNPSGVTCKFAEIIHPTITQLNNGSGDTTWHTPAGSSVVVSLAPNPGISGFYAGNGSNSLWSDVEHNHYIAISASPDSIGSKLFALYISLEYY